MKQREPHRDWNDIVDELLRERLARSEETEFKFDDLTAEIPLSFGENAASATWRLDGQVTVRIEGEQELADQPLAEWLSFWARYTPESKRE